MNILIIGAGAVGAVYGWHLRQAGHNVVFYTKRKYQAQVSAGLTLHRITRRQTTRQDWAHPSVITSLLEVKAEPWDQVWLTIPSNALRDGSMTLLLEAIGTATLISLQPDIEDIDYVRAHVADPDQVIQGLIPFISYQSPLPHTIEPKGISYYLPPFSKGLYAGAPERLKPLLEVLHDGGLSAKGVENFHLASAANTAFLQPMIAALELNNWHLTDFPTTESAKLGLAAAREALAIVRQTVGATTTPFKPLLWEKIWTLIIPLSQYLIPLPLEAYLQYHFTKVGAQTRVMLDTYIRLGQQRGLAVEKLQELRGKL